MKCVNRIQEIGGDQIEVFKIAITILTTEKL